MLLYFYYTPKKIVQEEPKSSREKLGRNFLPIKNFKKIFYNFFYMFLDRFAVRVTCVKRSLLKYMFNYFCMREYHKILLIIFFLFYLNLKIIVHIIHFLTYGAIACNSVAYQNFWNLGIFMGVRNTLFTLISDFLVIGFYSIFHLTILKFLYFFWGSNVIL